MYHFPSFSQKFFKDDNKYVVLQIFGVAGGYRVIISRVVHRKLWFPKEEQVRYVQYAKSLSFNAIIECERKHAEKILREWK
jgi:hypothetical protein